MIEVAAGGYWKIFRKEGDVKEVLGIAPYKGFHQRQEKLVGYIENLMFQQKVFADVLSETLMEIK
jgi:hypothetical protein